jgi:CubicO group peptidase (beta-lactamase class C family)
MEATQMRRHIESAMPGGRSYGLSFLILAAVLILPVLLSAQTYFPGRWDDWESRDPGQVGMDPQLVERAVAFALENQNKGPKDLAAVIRSSWGGEPGFRILGPTRHRGDTSGMIIRHGYIVAEWGDTLRADMTFSVTKSFLSTIAALALDRGLIRDVHDPVKMYVQDGKFDSEHNAKITWHHLLQQTSDWEGTLFETPDWADRPVPQNKPDLWQRRPLNEPGSHFKYNDVRVNLLAYCLLQVWRRPLPQVLRESVMDPIGASPTWRWHGYENSWVLVDGTKIQSVSGGGHFGGGLFISTKDQARFGLLFLRRGIWNGKRLFSEQWIDRLRTPAEAFSGYGYMWWLNTGRRSLPDIPEHIYYASGSGGNFIFVDDKNDLVVVVRWMPRLNDFMKLVIEAVKKRSAGAPGSLPLGGDEKTARLPGTPAAGAMSGAAAPTVPVRQAPDLGGTWVGQTEVPGVGTIDVTLVLKEAEKGSSGMMSSDHQGVIRADTEIRDVERDGEKFSFVLPLADGTLLSMKLAVTGDRMTGHWEHPAGTTGAVAFVKKK